MDELSASDIQIYNGMLNVLSHRELICYHGCVHNMLHEKDKEILHGLYKAASFVTQAICFKQTDNYVVCQKDLLDFVSEEEQIIVQIFLHLKNGGAVDFIKMSDTLFLWAKKWIQRL